MNTPLTTSQIEAMRRAAKKLVRDEGIIYGHALDRLANDHGYRNWSLLQKNGAPDGPQPYVFRRTDEEMAAALRVVPDTGRWDRRSRSDVALSQTKDIHDKFISAANAIDYAVAYIEALLRQKRFRLDTKAVALWEMRCWLPYGIVNVDGLQKTKQLNSNASPSGHGRQARWTLAPNLLNTDASLDTKANVITPGPPDRPCPSVCASIHPSVSA